MLWIGLYFVGPFEPTNRQQMLKSIGMAEVPGALGFGAINRPINAFHPSLGILADE